MNRCFVIVTLCWLFVIKICYAVTYTDQWAVHIEGGEEVAKDIASKHGFTFLGEIFSDYYHFHHRSVSKRSISPSSHVHEPLSHEPQVRWVEQQVAKSRVKRDYKDLRFNDPKWPRMWYLNRGRGHDMNVQEAWKKGFTGKRVTVTILDDGIEKDHPDLKKNYDPQASFDVNSYDPDPTPRYDYTNENRHGTRCAGEVAAEANNGICSVGVAFDANIGGVRMLDGDVTDAVEARSLSHNPQHIDIYSASWGPDDDGQTVDGPAPLAKKAFEDGIEQGRGGKGSIFVWASGNGGRDGDSCNCDGYTNSIHTLSISSVTENEHIPWYSEACSSTLTTTYSSGSGGERQIVTTDLRKDCTEYHTGTSASAPLAAGICALALQANPSLTWRDMQHIVVETSRPDDLHASDWLINGNGKKVSHHFGFGLMDAGAMVTRALNWTNVPDQHRCEIYRNMPSRRIPANSGIDVHLDSDGCRGASNEVIYLEHVQAKITLQSSRRGQIEIFLISPSGTKSTLLAKRSRDTSTEGFNNWDFMTTHSWGEMSMGRWTLMITNSGHNSSFRNWTLVLYGTATHPQAGSYVPRHPETDQECIGQEVFFDGKCRERCPSTFFAHNETYQVPVNNTSVNTTQGSIMIERWGLVCSRCHVSCFECFGPSSQQCKSCNRDGYTLTNDTCVYHYKEDILDYFLDHQKGIVIILLAVCGLGAFFVFAITFLILQCRSYGKCKCCKKTVEEDYVTKYNRNDNGRISLGGKNTNLRNSNIEHEAQQEALLTEVGKNDIYEDDEEDFDTINFEPNPRGPSSTV